MPVKRLVMLFTFIVTIGMATGLTAAEAQETPIQLSLFSPIQIAKEETSVKGLRLSLLYGRNVNLMGLDIGCVCWNTGNVKGFQYGLVGITEGRFAGWQDNFWNQASDFAGFQSGGINKADTAEGFQWGLVNITKSMSGFQLGLLNMTENLNGLQIGILNVVSNKESLPVLPLVNWAF